MRTRLICRAGITLLIVFAYASQALADQCWVVSGLKKDEKQQAFANYKNLLTKETSKLRGKKCQVFDDWHALYLFFGGMTDGKPNVAPSEKITILQGAHGSPGGTAVCNARDERWPEIIGKVNDIAKAHPVAFVAESCYSGDLMRRKLVEDSGHPESKSIDNLCMVTSSVFGRVSFTSFNGMFSSIENAKPGQSIEQAFASTDSGLISSAEWDGSGVTEYFTKEELRHQIQALEGMRRTAQYCSSTKLSSSARLCFSPDVNDVYLDRFLKRNSDAKILWEISPLEAEFGKFGPLAKMEFFDSCELAIKNADQAAAENSGVSAFLSGYFGADARIDGNKARSMSSCLQSWVKFLQDGALAPQNVDFTSDSVLAAYREFEKKPEFDSCKKGSDTVKSGGPFRLCGQSTVIQRMNQRIEGSFDRVRDEIVAEVARSRTGFRFNDREPLSLEDIHRKKKLFASVMGEAFFDSEYMTDSKCGTFAAPDLSSASPSLAMYAFIRGSLEKPKFESQLDQRRRNACRNFKIE